MLGKTLTALSVSNLEKSCAFDKGSVQVVGADKESSGDTEPEILWSCLGELNHLNSTKTKRPQTMTPAANGHVPPCWGLTLGTLGESS